MLIYEGGKSKSLAEFVYNVTVNKNTPESIDATTEKLHATRATVTAVSNVAS